MKLFHRFTSIVVTIFTYNFVDFQVCDFHVVVCYSVSIFTVQTETFSKIAVTVERKRISWTGYGSAECTNVMPATTDWTVTTLPIPSMVCITDRKLHWIEWPLILQTKDEGVRVIYACIIATLLVVKIFFSKMPSIRVSFNIFTIRVPALWQVATVDCFVCVVQHCHRGDLTITLLVERRSGTSVPADLV